MSGILKIIGSGSTSNVYRIGNYAIKSYGSKFNMGKIIREIYFLSYYKHENIIEYHKTYMRNKEIRLKLEYYGICLGKLRNEKNKLERINNVLIGIGKALCFLHKNGICHRDVSPFNILCSTNGVKLCDFGSAIFAESYDLDVISKHFAPPEKIKEPKSDIYSLMVSIMYYYEEVPDLEEINKIKLSVILSKGLSPIDIRITASELLLLLGIEYNPEILNIEKQFKLCDALFKDDAFYGYDDLKKFKKDKYKLF